MRRIIDAVSIGLLVLATVAFGMGFNALGEERDLAAAYWLVVGALLLKSSVELLRPRPDSSP